MCGSRKHVAVAVAVKVIHVHLRAVLAERRRTKLPFRARTRRRRSFPPSLFHEKILLAVAIDVARADAVREFVRAGRSVLRDPLDDPRFGGIACIWPGEREVSVGTVGLL